MKARNDAVSGKSRAGVESWLRGMKKCTVYQGHARFVSPTEVSVGAERLFANRYLSMWAAERWSLTCPASRKLHTQ